MAQPAAKKEDDEVAALRKRFQTFARTQFAGTVKNGLRHSPIGFSCAALPCGRCLPAIVNTTYPTPAGAPIKFNHTKVTSLDPKYLARRSSLGEQTLQLPDGRNLCLFEDDDGSGGTPVLFLHGTGSNKLRWLQKAPIPGVRLIAVDRPGYGNSDPLPEAAAPSAYVHDLLALCDTLGVERFYICGHSNGCLWALVMAACVPERVAGLMLNSPPRRTVGPLPPQMASFFGSRWMSQLLGTAEALQRSKDEFPAAETEWKLSGARYAQFAADPFWVSVMYEAQRCFKSDKALAAAMATDNGIIGSMQLPFDTAPIQCPVYVSTGDADMMTGPSNAHALRDKLAPTTTVQVEIIHSCAHFLAVGPVDDFAARLRFPVCRLKLETVPCTTASLRAGGASYWFNRGVEVHRLICFWGEGRRWASE